MVPEERYRLIELHIGRFVEHAKAKLEDNLLSIALFGSAARGTLGPDSDVDILVIVRDVPLEPFGHARMAVELTEPVSGDLFKNWQTTGWMPYFSVLVRPLAEASQPSRIYFDMTEEARILFDRDDTLKRILDRTRNRLETLGAKRIWVGSNWYWDLKPDYKPGDVIEL